MNLSELIYNLRKLEDFEIIPEQYIPIDLKGPKGESLGYIVMKYFISSFDEKFREDSFKNKVSTISSNDFISQLRDIDIKEFNRNGSSGTISHAILRTVNKRGDKANYYRLEANELVLTHEDVYGTIDRNLYYVKPRIKDRKEEDKCE